MNTSVTAEDNMIFPPQKTNGTRIQFNRMEWSVESIMNHSPMMPLTVSPPNMCELTHQWRSDGGEFDWNHRSTAATPVVAVDGNQVIIVMLFRRDYKPIICEQFTVLIKACWPICSKFAINVRSDECEGRWMLQNSASGYYRGTYMLLSCAHSTLYV